VAAAGVGSATQPVPCTFPVPSLYLPCTFPVGSATPPVPRNRLLSSSAPRPSPRLQIESARRITDTKEAALRAAELYELLNDTMLPSSFDLSQTNQSLDRSCAEFRSRLIEPAFTSFLGTPHCATMLRRLSTRLAEAPHTGRAMPLPLVCGAHFCLTRVIEENVVGL